MKLNKLVRLAGWLVSSLVISSGASGGVIWNEQAPGAGSLTSTAQIVVDSVVNPLSGIVGALNSVFLVGASSPVYEVDVYELVISNFNTFSASTVSSNPADDTALFLFDSLGLGVFMNDDNGTDLLSLLPVGDPLGPISNGIYYLAVALGGFDAFADIGNTIANFLPGSFTDVRGGDTAAGALASWASPFAAGTESPFGYSIELTGASTLASVPEPATLALVLFGLAGAAASRRAATGRRH